MSGNINPLAGTAHLLDELDSTLPSIILLILALLVYIKVILVSRETYGVAARWADVDRIPALRRSICELSPT